AAPIGRTLDRRDGRRRLDQIGRDEDDHVGFAFLKPTGTEKLSEDRNVAEPWHLRDVLLERVRQQAAKGKALAADKFARRLRSPHRKGWNRYSVVRGYRHRDGTRVGQLTDLGANA